MKRRAKSKATRHAFFKTSHGVQPQDTGLTRAAGLPQHRPCFSSDFTLPVLTYDIEKTCFPTKETFFHLLHLKYTTNKYYTYICGQFNIKYNTDMSYLITPEGYSPLLDMKQTELGIKQIKEFFQMNLSSELRLRRVTAPLFVLRGLGINDDLNGVERAVSFPIKDMGEARAEVVHSLAKWKRLTLAEYHIEPGYGIYTDMNAIRADEELGNLHSLYVDQWDWERVITQQERNVEFLKEIVKRIYAAMVRTEYMVYETYPQIKPSLPQEVHFIHAEELRQLYPDKAPKCREHEIARKHKAVFVIGIGCTLGDGKKHDGRAPDYDDFTTPGLNGLPGLNGDLILWDETIQRSIELSSMGIRVNSDTLRSQLKEAGEEKRLELYFHKRLMEGTLPLSIGGGIGQSRLCMFYLRKAHIGEIQASIWPQDMRSKCEEHNIHLI